MARRWRSDGPAAGVDLLVSRGRTSLRARIARLRAKGFQVGQCAVAGGAAWFVASELLGHRTPFFAPIAAVVSLGTSYGQRLRRVSEVTLGVAVGVFLGDLLTHWLGSGGLQIMLIVALAMSAALLLDAGAIFVTQAAVQSIVVSVLIPQPGQAFVRWTDALVGGAVALVAASIVPQAPLRRPREQAAVVMTKVAGLLNGASECIRSGDAERALRLLVDARSTDGLIGELRAASDEGLSVLASSPFRRRHRGRVRQMVELVEPLDFTLRNTRVLVRRVAVAAHRGVPIPASHAALVSRLAVLAEEVAAELRADRLAAAVVEPLVVFGQETSLVERTEDLNSDVVLAQVRSIVADLLAVCGVDPLEATDLIPPLPPTAP